MSHPVGHGGGIDTGSEKLCHMGVPEIVEADAPDLGSTTQGREAVGDL
jgi:hypothetical protein